ncbi:MAG: sensor histidine kinase [Oscillospiraceae bacterium]|jgi:two-component system sensor histidine kinase YesM|nr:sensor histidine kinase [Oscillospiraceae bacterium]
MMKKMSLKKRLNMLSILLIVPLTGLVIYLLVSLTGFCNAYSQVVSNIDETNAFCGAFKEDIDYVMYREVIGSQTYRQIYQLPEDKRPFGWEQMKNPYQLIANARKTFQNVMANTQGEANLNDVRWTLHSLDRLETVIKDVDSSIENGGSYKKNYSHLQLDIYTLTSNIKETMQDYVYREALHFREVQNQLNEKGQTAVRLSVLLLFLIVCLGIKFSAGITKSVTDPIQNLCKATRRVAKGDFTQKASGKSADELSILADSFDNMQEEIGRLIDNIKQEQNQRRVLELRLLQEQINPHFLYNTLGTIVWLAEDGQDEQVVSMVTSLSTFFRSTLSNGRSFVSIAEETRHISSYLEIQQVRYQDILTYEIKVDKELLPYQILKLTLQPLVENALYHGIKNKRAKGKIIVRGYRQGESAIFEVSDNGIGMTEEEQANLKKVIRRETMPHEHGFGLANVDERLRLNYGETYGLSFTSAYGVGTTFQVRVPLQEGKEK